MEKSKSGKDIAVKSQPEFIKTKIYLDSFGSALGGLKGLFEKSFRCAFGHTGSFYVFFINFSLHLGQVMAILPFPLGTRTG